MSSAESYPGFNTRPREGHLRVLSRGNVRVGEYLSRNLFVYAADNSVLMTTDSVDEALKVRITPAGNPGVIECFNGAMPEFKFLGVALNRAAAVIGPGSEDWGAVTYVSNPSGAVVTSAFNRAAPVRGAGWVVGAGGEIWFEWTHTDGCVYKLRHSVEVSNRRLYNVSNLPAYVGYYYKDDPSKQVEVQLVFEPLDQTGV
ncbi:hypothetical protein EXIGLDRAFT_777157 [Exidia glandulosa HHB12029]|uniref:Uncharacterized protein n=1 Tax=Exidia glandulosa HHB12029 TaxID=1314781 RepID=A0A165D636_EXIGL|nr:hypothetical protein EXIGLDRAFT_777157 [Exidia glandulosa HHB12029]